MGKPTFDLSYREVCASPRVNRERAERHATSGHEKVSNPEFIGV